MTTTLGTIRAQIRSDLDEATARYWTDAELNTWINEAAKDIAKRSETLLTKHTATSVVAGTNTYTLPTDVVRINGIEYVETGSTQVQPLHPATRPQMETIWGLNQGQLGTPQFYIPWGFSPSMTVQLFPVPSIGGTLNIYYYRLPALAVSDGNSVEVPQGWEDLIVHYVEYRAKRKDRDPTWQEAKALYEEGLRSMSEQLRHLHDQQQFITTSSGVGVPRWLYEFDD